MGYKNLLIFMLGTAIGAGGMYLYCKDKIELEVEEQVNSVKEEMEHYKAQISAKDHVEKLKDANEERRAMAEAAKEKPDIMTFKKKIAQTNYGKAFEKTSEPENETQETWDPPYVIEEEAFAESEYDVVSLNYYHREQVLADDNGHVFDIEDTIGWDAMTRLLEGDDDILYVRSDKYHIDYEVLLSDQDYEERGKDNGTT